MVLNLNAIVENPQLDELLNKRNNLSKDQKDEEGTLLREITDETVTNANFLAVAILSKPPIKTESGTWIMEKGTNISFLMLSSSTGESYLPIFSSNKELESWHGIEQYNTAVLTFDDIAQIVQHNISCKGITLNPFSDNLIMQRKLVENIFQRKQIQRNGRAVQILSNDTKIIFPKNHEIPIQLSSKLCEQAKEISSISRMWLRCANIDENDSYLLIVDFNGDREEIFRKLGDSARPFIKENRLMHIVSVKDKIPDEWTRNIIPVYSK